MSINELLVCLVILRFLSPFLYTHYLRLSVSLSLSLRLFLHLSVSLSLCLSVSPYLRLFLHLSVSPASLDLSVSRSIRRLSVSPSPQRLSISRSLGLFVVSLSLRLSVSPSLNLSVSTSSLCLSASPSLVPAVTAPPGPAADHAQAATPTARPRTLRTASETIAASVSPCSALTLSHVHSMDRDRRRRGATNRHNAPGKHMFSATQGIEPALRLWLFFYICGGMLNV